RLGDGGSLVQARCDLSTQVGDFARYGVPDQFVVDTEIRVDQPIAHSRHGTPIDSGMRCAECLRQLFRRLADDLEAPYERTLERLVGEELLRREIAAAFDQIISLHQDVPEVLTRLEGHRRRRREYAAR